MKQLVRRLAPRSALDAYHRGKAFLAAFWYRWPSHKLFMVGVTGTKGKSTTANFIWAGLTGAGIKTALISTANLRLGDTERLNAYHMTMPSPFAIEGFLRDAVRMGCGAAVVETTSEGMLQHREKGMSYDIAVFTNLTPEHLPSHGGSFDAYRRAKQTLFRNLARGVRKELFGRQIPKAIIANADSPEAPHFLEFPADRKLTWSIEGRPADIRAAEITERLGIVSFVLEEGARRLPVTLHISGRFNASNALAAFAVGETLDLDPEHIRRGIEKLMVIPGRMEILATDPFIVIVDYAHERESMQALLTSARTMRAKGGRIIVLLGAEGGGRDKRKRPLMGALAGELADIAIVSNVDPYEEDPDRIMRDIAEAARNAGKIEHRDLFCIADRRAGIRKALELARPGDIVLVTGKGSEQSMIFGSREIAWDDRMVVREELQRMRKR